MINDISSSSGGPCPCLDCQAHRLQDRLKAEGRHEDAAIVQRLSHSHVVSGNFFDFMRGIADERFYTKKGLWQRLGFWRRMTTHADNEHSKIHWPEMHAHHLKVEGRLASDPIRTNLNGRDVVILSVSPATESTAL